MHMGVPQENGQATGDGVDRPAHSAFRGTFRNGLTPHAKRLTGLVDHVGRHRLENVVNDGIAPPLRRRGHFSGRHLDAGIAPTVRGDFLRGLETSRIAYDRKPGQRGNDADAGTAFKTFDQGFSVDGSESGRPATLSRVGQSSFFEVLFLGLESIELLIQEKKERPDFFG